MFGGGKKGTPDNEPTLKTLAGREVPVQRDRDGRGDRGAGDRRLPQVPRHLAARAAARRGDAPDRRPRDGPGRQQERRPAARRPTTRRRSRRYNDFLKAYPNDPGNDRVLYQLARAYEQGGDLNTALKTLDRLVKDYPLNRFRDEAQFRRGELLFTARDYPNAEKAFATVLAGGADRALPRPLALHAGLVAVQAGPARGRPALVLRRARPEDRRQEGRRRHRDPRRA